jgi:methylated-DNA-protein-cysteine methyltransferase-like protein
VKRAKPSLRRSQAAERRNAAEVPPAPNRNQRVWAVVRRIPRGRVATYKQIAEHAVLPGPTGPRQVGYALAALPADTRIPWQRVINAQGCVSSRGPHDDGEHQRELLALEGVAIGLDGRIDLARYGWRR